MSNKRLFYNGAFIIVCLGIFIFLWNAPEETTAHLPNNKAHTQFMAMDKKEAEKFCGECHGPEAVAPLPHDHPPKYRCLFCHKKETEE